MSFYREVAGYMSLIVADFVKFLDTLCQACCGEDKRTANSAQNPGISLRIRELGSGIPQSLSNSTEG